MSSKLNAYLELDSSYATKLARLQAYEDILRNRQFYIDAGVNTHYGTLQENGIYGQVRKERMLTDYTEKDDYIYNFVPALYPYFVNADHQELSLFCLVEDPEEEHSLEQDYDSPHDCSRSVILLDSPVVQRSLYEKLLDFVEKLRIAEDDGSYAARVLNDLILFEAAKLRINSLIMSVANDFLSIKEVGKRREAFAIIQNVFQENNISGEEVATAFQQQKNALQQYLRQGFLKGLSLLIQKQLEKSRRFADGLMSPVQDRDCQLFIYQAKNIFDQMIDFKLNVQSLLDIIEGADVGEHIAELSTQIAQITLHTHLTYLCAHTMGERGIEKLPIDIDASSKFSTEVVKRLHFGLLGAKSIPLATLESIRQNTSDTLDRKFLGIPLDIIFLFTAVVGIATIALSLTVLSAGLAPTVILTALGGLTTGLGLFGVREAAIDKGIVENNTKISSMLIDTCRASNLLVN
jgi:hypothetical protein